MEEKSIILIRPDLKTNSELSAPLGLISLGSFLNNKKYNVTIVDLMAGDDYREVIRNKSNNCLFIGLTVMTAHIPSALEISKFIKMADKNVPIVWGGIHPTLYPEQTISDNNVDIVIPGDGEYACFDLAECLRIGSEISSVKGIFYKDETGKIVFTGQRIDSVNLDSLPFLDYDLVELDKYIYRNIDLTFAYSYSGVKDRHLAVIGSLGCKFRCAFCVNPIVHHRTQRVKSASRLLDEIEYFISKYNTHFFYIRDEDFFGNKKRLMEFLSGIKSRKIRFKWCANGRCTYFNDNYINNELLKFMIELGLYRLGVGAESGSQRVLDILKKDIKVKDIENLAYMTKDKDIVVIFSFMTGIPGEDRDDLIKTIKFINKLKKINPMNFINGPQLYRPYPGGALFDLCVKLGLNQPENLEGWCAVLDSYSGFISPKDLPWLRDFKELDLIYFYLRVMFKRIKVLTRDWRLVYKIPLFLLLKLMGELRLRFNFWALPFEKEVYTILIKSIGLFAKK